MAQAKCALCHKFLGRGSTCDICGVCDNAVSDLANERTAAAILNVKSEASSWRNIASQRQRDVDNRDRLLRTLETRRNEIKAALDETGGQLVAARTELSYANATIERMKYASRRETVGLFLTHVGAMIVGGILAVSIWEAMAR